jgi:hypothetical protein
MWGRYILRVKYWLYKISYFHCYFKNCQHQIKNDWYKKLGTTRADIDFSDPGARTCLSLEQLKITRENLPDLRRIVNRVSDFIHAAHPCLRSSDTFNPFHESDWCSHVFRGSVPCVRSVNDLSASFFFVNKCILMNEGGKDGWQWRFVAYQRAKCKPRRHSTQIESSQRESPRADLRYLKSCIPAVAQEAPSGIRGSTWKSSS